MESRSQCDGDVDREDQSGRCLLALHAGFCIRFYLRRGITAFCVFLGTLNTISKVEDDIQIISRILCQVRKLVSGLCAVLPKAQSDSKTWKGTRSSSPHCLIIAINASGFYNKKSFVKAIVNICALGERRLLVSRSHVRAEFLGQG